MEKKRILVLDEKTESAILTICDVALRFSGMHMATVVADIALAIQDRNVSASDDEW